MRKESFSLETFVRFMLFMKIKRGKEVELIDKYSVLTKQIFYNDDREGTTVKWINDGNMIDDLDDKRMETDCYAFSLFQISARDLPGADQSGFNDPYMRLFLLPEVDARKRETNVHPNEGNPFFDEHFKFPVSQEDLVEKIITLQVILFKFDFPGFLGSATAIQTKAKQKPWLADR